MGCVRTLWLPLPLPASRQQGLHELLLICGEPGGTCVPVQRTLVSAVWVDIACVFFVLPVVQGGT